jgi:chondroitin sulfate synthase
LADPLLLFLDIDIVYNRSAVARVRRNTVRNVQIYYPVVFSEYAPSTWSTQPNNADAHFDYERTHGAFRHFGYGIVGVYASDLQRVGGVATDIRGWGLEDVDLFEKCVRDSILRIWRAPEPAFVHVYHAVVCDTSAMPEAQIKMCVDSRDASYASVWALADRYYELREHQQHVNQAVPAGPAAAAHVADTRRRRRRRRRR